MQQIGHYRLIGELGRGGMGVVYRALDTQLNREVALKVLPEVFASDSQRLGRFQREAQTLAALNHPNIAQIYGLEDVTDRDVLEKEPTAPLISETPNQASSDSRETTDLESIGIQAGTKCLVMELVEGEDLSDRIERGPLSLDEALQMACQIAEALLSAHEKGIIHRDLKPANIKLTPEGNIKVLDFGLAKALEGEPDKGNLSQSPTLTMAATQAGVILGTAAYMAPEQAKGYSADRRADIWAFGAVLYEMLCGRRAFEGDDVSEVLASVLAREPKIERLPEDLDPRVIRLLNRCLQKNPSKRLRDIGDVLLDLREIMDSPSEVTTQDIPELTAHAQSRWSWVAVACAATALGALVTYFILPSSPSSVPKSVSRFDVQLPDGLQYSGLNFRSLAFAPDGSRFAFVANGQLHIRELERFDTYTLGEVQAAISPVFSPDGEWLAFRSENRIRKVSVKGGSSIALCNAETWGISWDDPSYLVFSDSGQSIKRVGSGGGIAEEILQRGNAQEQLCCPQVLPGGSHLLYEAYLAPEGKFELRLASIDNPSDERVVLVGAEYARYLPTGHILYADGNALMAVRFDMEDLEVVGGPVPVVEGVARRAPTAASQYAVAGNGSLVYLAGDSLGKNFLCWVDRDGRQEEIPLPSNAFEAPRLSPDGRQLALVIDGEIWVYDIERETLTRFTFQGGTRPVWSPDGRKLIFSSRENRLFVIQADGRGEPELLLETDVDLHSNDWSRDGSKFVFHDHSSAGNTDLWIMDDPENTRQSRRLLESSFNEDGPVFSPDGNWIAYSSDESGRNEIFVQPVEGEGKKLQISNEGGQQPIWAPSGELFYRHGRALMSVKISTTPELKAERPRELFSGSYLWGSFGPFAAYDTTDDGSRFVMVKPEDDRNMPMRVVLNWFEELRRQLPQE